MSTIKSKRDPCEKIIRCSEDAENELSQNIEAMDNLTKMLRTSSEPLGISFAEDMEQLQHSLLEMRDKIHNVKSYCKRVRDWMDDYWSS